MWYWAIPPVDRSHTFGWPLTFGTKCTRDLPVSHVVWHNTSMGGIKPYHMAGKFEKRTVYERQFVTCGIPKSVRMEISLTSWNDSRHCKRKTLKFWSKNVFQKKRRVPPKTDPDSRGAGRERMLRSLTERDLQIPHWAPSIKNAEDSSSESRSAESSEITRNNRTTLNPSPVEIGPVLTKKNMATPSRTTFARGSASWWRFTRDS